MCEFLFVIIFVIIKSIFDYINIEDEVEYTKNGVPYTITGPGIGHKKAYDIIRSKKIKEQLKKIKVKKINA